MKERARRIWDIEDTALLIYAEYKGLSNSDLAKLFQTTSPSISAKRWHVRNPEGDSARVQKTLDKAMQVEGRVRAGFEPDHRAMWDRRIGEINGIKYDYKEPEADDMGIPEYDPKTMSKQEAMADTWSYQDDSKDAKKYANTPPIFTEFDPAKHVVPELSTILEVKVNLDALNQLFSLLKE